MKTRAACKDAEGWISAAIDGEKLPGDSAASLEEHLKSCAACRAFRETQQKESDLLRGALACEPEARDRLKAAIARSAREARSDVVIRPRLWRAPGVLGLAAAALLLAAGTWWLLVPPAPPGGSAVSSPKSPVAPTAASSMEPWRISLERTRWVEDPPQLPSGMRWGHEIRRVRSWMLDPGSLPGVPEGQGPGRDLRRGDLLLESQRTQARHFRFAGWNYH